MVATSTPPTSEKMEILDGLMAGAYACINTQLQTVKASATAAGLTCDLGGLIDDDNAAEALEAAQRLCEGIHDILKHLQPQLLAAMVEAAHLRSMLQDIRQVTALTKAVIAADEAVGR